jgi:hypothetical protein
MEEVVHQFRRCSRVSRKQYRDSSSWVENRISCKVLAGYPTSVTRGPARHPVMSREALCDLSCRVVSGMGNWIVATCLLEWLIIISNGGL